MLDDIIIGRIGSTEGQSADIDAWEGGARDVVGDDWGGLEASGRERSASKSQLKLSRNPRRSVVSDGENRSADDGSGAGRGGNSSESAGSNAYSNSENGTGGCGDDGLDMITEV